MEIVDVLRGAKEILSDEGLWCRTGWGRKPNGDPGVAESECESLCLVNALIRAANRGGVSATPAHAHLMAVHGGSVMGFNDRPETSHADVIGLLDRAILALADQRQVERESEAAQSVAPVADACAVLVGE